jgi:N-methylhydantoinase A
MLLGIDTGGTFTDFVYYDGRTLRIHKVLSTPADPAQAILQGVAEMALSLDGLRVVHGSTVATNAVLEGKGARTVFITNHGLKDLLTLGRQARRELYNLQPDPLPPPVEPGLCLESGGRLGCDGDVVEPLSDAELDELVAAVQALMPEAVAINLLFSFLDDGFEKRIADALPAELFVSRSSEVLPEYREYERGMATWLNAYVGPLMQGYLARLADHLAPAAVSVMQSAGTTAEARLAGRAAVRLLLSGPAGGLAGARYIAGLSGRTRLLSFDMGGTSTDVALIDGELRLTSEGHIAGYPVAVPMVDMHTIGAGGGSLARVDAGGLLLVGPESAGADPGPACYGRGGTAATVTDANLVLGRLQPDAFLGGAMRLDSAAARQAVAAVAAALGLPVEDTAAGIIEVANEHMARALRVMSVQRGLDPQDFTLVSFGGAGGLHVCALAEALAMHSALVPVHAGVLSALGMLVAPPGREVSRTVNGLLEALSEDLLQVHFEELEAGGRASLVSEGIPVEKVTASRSLDLRYQGQSYTLNVPWQDLLTTMDNFHLAHQRRFGHRLDLPVELVNVRVAVKGPLPGLAVQATTHAGSAPAAAQLYGIDAVVPVMPRDSLSPGQSFPGPMLITETVATTYVAPGWQVQRDKHGNLLLTR